MSDLHISVNVDSYLAVDKFEPDGEAHIKLIDNPPMDEFMKLVRVCPAALYKVTEDGAQRFDYSGCLECGTCRIMCGDTIIKQWTYPGPGCGVQYRYG